MVRILLAIGFMLCASTSEAAFWVKFNPSTTYDARCVIGDGVKLGAVASYTTYDSPLSGWKKSDIVECEEAKLPLKKVVGGVLTDMTQADIDGVAAAKAQAQADATTARLLALDDDVVKARSITLTKADNAIDNIGSLDDAKVFLKKLVRYVVSINNGI